MRLKGGRSSPKFSLGTIVSRAVWSGLRLEPRGQDLVEFPNGTICCLLRVIWPEVKN
jgi:G3E family GTPase